MAWCVLSAWGHSEVAEEFTEVPNSYTLELGNFSHGSVRTERNRRTFSRAMSPADWTYWNLTAYTGLTLRSGHLLLQRARGPLSFWK